MFTESQNQYLKMWLKKNMHKYSDKKKMFNKMHSDFVKFTNQQKLGLLGGGGSVGSNGDGLNSKGIQPMELRRIKVNERALLTSLNNLYDTFKFICSANNDTLVI
jgi:hypothetical protein